MLEYVKGVHMLEYLWLDDESPILKQIPIEYTSAVILFSPFIQMPEGWEKAKRKIMMSIFIQMMRK